MSIISKIVNPKQTVIVEPQNQLSHEELEFLLNSLKETTIVGSQVEMFYNLVIKLQNQYIEQQSK